VVVKVRLRTHLNPSRGYGPGFGWVPHPTRTRLRVPTRVSKPMTNTDAEEITQRGVSITVELPLQVFARMITRVEFLRVMI